MILQIEYHFLIVRCCKGVQMLRRQDARRGCCKCQINRIKIYSHVRKTVGMFRKYLLIIREV